MLMRSADPVDIKKPRREQGAGSRFRRRRSFAEQFNVKPTFFARFAQCGLLRIFIKLNMPAEWQPLVQCPMVNEQDFRLLDHKDRDGKINLVVNMRHCMSPCTPQSGRSARQVSRRGLAKYKW